MYKIEIKAEISNGELTIDSHEFKRLVRCLANGKAKLTVELLPTPKTIEEYRAWYFAMRDIVAAETGNTKKAVHEWAKDKCNNGDSTTNLVEDAWKFFIKRFKSEVYEHFNVYL